MGNQVVQQPQPLGRDIRDEKIDARRVTTRTGKASDKIQLNRICADAENDRDRRGGRFGGERGGIAAGRRNDTHATADQVGHDRRQAIVFSPQPVVLDRHVLAFDVADFVEAFSERGHTTR